MSHFGFSADPAPSHTPMDVAFFIEPAMLAGEAAFVRHLVMGMKLEGQEVTFIAPQGMSLSSLPVLGSRVLTYRWNRWEKLPVLQPLRLNAVARELNDNPPDVLVAWGSSDTGSGGALSMLTQMVPALPVVLWCWDASELFTPTAKLPSIRHLVVSSQTIRDRMPPEPAATDIAGKIPGPSSVPPPNTPPPVTVVHPGVYAEETVACFDVDGQIPCLVSLDPLSDRPAYEALLRACRLLADGTGGGGGESGTSNEFLLFAYDTGSAEYPIWRLAEELKMLDLISFVPFQQEAELLLLHGDLYIHIVPSSRVQYRTLEAMGRGLCVVTCPNHSADYLLDGQTCRVVGPQTPESWRDALLELITDRPKAAALARRAQQYVREHHSMARTLEQFNSICRQAAGLSIPITGR